MKWWSILLLVHIANLRVSAQESINLAGMGIYAEHQVWLRWAPKEWTMWTYPTDCGFRIERWEVEVNGTPVNPLGWQATGIRFPALKCLPAGEWEPLLQTDTFAGIAAICLWGSRDQSLPSMDRILDQENRQSLVLWAADHSFQTAQSLGLGWVDTTVLANRVYAYRIASDCNDLVSDSLLLLVPTYQAYRWPAVEDLSIHYLEQGLQLQWHPYADVAYSSFELSRSEDGTNWQTLLPANLLVIDPEQQSGGPYYFTDTTVTVDKNYHYRLRGMTPFGWPGPWSGEVQGKALPLLPELDLRIINLHEVQTRVQLAWTCKDQVAEQFTHWSLWRANTPQGKFELLTAGQPMNLRTWMDNDPLASNYYRIEAEDAYGRVVSSHLAFYQLEDSIPPPWPKWFQGVADTSGKVTLTWAASAAPDLKGYRLYRNYRPVIPAELLTSTISPDTGWQETLALGHRLEDSIYYTLRTVDFRENESDYMPFIAVHLPDRIPPTAPVISGRENSRQGVHLTFVPSDSRDVLKYALERRPGDSAEWTVIQDYLQDELPARMLDSLTQPGKDYSYRLRAIDDAGLESVSQELTGHRFETGYHAAEIQFQAQKRQEDSRHIALSWQASDHRNVEYVIIYRSIGRKPFERFRMLSVDTMHVPNGGLEGKYTDALTDWRAAVRYKILLQYRDGKYSDWSPTIEILP
ncbi:MAG: fibronectin type III domain-containing protein [Saprospiraceae bacterium]